ncbi:MAG: methionyl-tRNA formyltransferase [Planctomycetota bacterium]|nr:MAG: methionyl-tRNA formyltransferase [Planctomycetota bacterium]
MKIVFMGTPQFGRDVLAAILDSKHEVAAVVTQPDRPKGRSKKPAPSPVKELALERGLEILQPEKPGEAECVDRLKEIGPGVIVVAAYGCILKPDVLDLPPKGCINVHGSLLPKHRGASPVPAAIQTGDPETGVTLQYMAEECDAGDVIAQRIIPIQKNDTAGTLLDRLAEIGGEMIVETLDRLEKGEPLPRNAQDHQGATFTKIIKKSDGKIDWSRPAVEIERHVRAMHPWPAAFTFVKMREGKPPVRMTVHAAKFDETETGSEPGTIIQCAEDGINIAAGRGALIIKELQLAGKKRMPVSDFVRGARIPEGSRCVDG